MKTTKKSQKFDTKELHGNIMKLALVAFFIVAVSFVGSVLNSDTFAVGEQSNVAASTVFTSTGTGNILQMSANGKPIIGLTFTKNSDGSFTFTGKADGKDVSGKLTAKEAKDMGVKETNKSAEAERCLKGEGENCRNKCTTSFVTVDKSGKPQTKDCYNKGEDTSKGAFHAIEELRKCIVEENKKAKSNESAPSNKDLNQLLCISTVPVKTGKSGITEINPDDSDDSTSVSVPKACKEKLQRVIDLREGKTDVQKTAAAGNDTACTWRGPVTCVSNSLQVAGLKVGGESKAFTCIRKIDGIKGGPASIPNPSCTGGNVQKSLCQFKQNMQQQFKQLQENLKKQAAQNALTRALTQQKPQMPGGGGSGSGSGGSSNNKCPEGYKLSTEQGRTVCTKETSTKPQCAIKVNKTKVAKGEDVKLQWRTANADDVDIAGYQDNLAKNSSEPKSVYLNETTTFKLVATAKDGKTKCEKDVEVVVDGEATGPTGSAPPKIACGPTSVIPQGGDGKVKWACTAAAKSSKGVNIDTEGKLASASDGVPVTDLEHNMEFTVMCLDENKKEIGKDSCALNVGKPLYDMIVYPTTAKRGDRIRISWGSLFMKSCTVRGPRNFNYTRDQGVVITEPFPASDTTASDQSIRAAIYNIECESIFGGKETRDIEVKFQEA